MDVVTIELAQLVDLLIKAHCTDAEQWPVQVRHGAALLASIRKFEQDCVAAHGKWDWELLSEEQQLDYDSACAQLDGLRRSLDPEPNSAVSFNEWLAKQDQS